MTSPQQKSTDLPGGSRTFHRTPFHRTPFHRTADGRFIECSFLSLFFLFHGVLWKRSVPSIQTRVFWDLLRACKFLSHLFCVCDMYTRTGGSRCERLVLTYPVRAACVQNFVGRGESGQAVAIFTKHPVFTFNL